jgi:hypothetical protein
MKPPVIISTTVRSSAGTMPAANRSAMEIPPPADAEYRMRLCDGGTSSATIAADTVTLTAKSRS